LANFEAILEIIEYLNNIESNTISNIVMISFRLMKANDLDDLLVIEQMNSLSPWTSEQFVEAQGYISVLLFKNLVIGFVAVLQFADQAELQNLSVHKDYQQLGYGRRLISYGIQNLCQNVKKIFLEVRVSNFTAIRLYHSFGFKEIGSRRDYYHTKVGREDALVMSLGITKL
jgi:ribosomal-protein-alanine N-acetyltransferase